MKINTRKPRTRADLLAHPFTCKVGDRNCQSVEDILWNEGEDGWWLFLANGYNYNGCSCLHEKTIRDLCDVIEMVDVGDPY